MDPTRGNKNGGTLFSHQSVALVHHITQKCLTLAAHSLPPFIKRQIARRRLNKIEYLLSFEYVVPHRRPTKVYVKI